MLSSQQMVHLSVAEEGNWGRPSAPNAKPGAKSCTISSGGCPHACICKRSKIGVTMTACTCRDVRPMLTTVGVGVIVSREKSMRTSSRSKSGVEQDVAEEEERALFPAQIVVGALVRIHCVLH